jgi:hypothetical protein
MIFHNGFVIAVALSLTTATQAASVAPRATVILPNQIQWRGHSGGGSRSAVLIGDPGKPGIFVQLLNIPSNTISQPHFHNKNRTYLVVKGHWDIGTGPNYETGSMKALPVGSIVTLPAHGIIYDGCKSAPCMIEIVGEGQDPDTMVDKDGKPLPPK